MSRFVVVFCSVLGLLVGLSSVAWAQDAPVLVVESRTGTVGATVTFDIVLKSASQGLQQYAFKFSVADPSVATIAEVLGVEIRGQFFQLGNVTASSAEFRALDLNNDVQPGAENLVLASVTLDVLASGSTAVELVVNAYVDDRGVKVDPDVTNGTLNAPGAVTAARSAPRAIPPSTVPPKDPDDDGLFEDVNGDGVVNADDVALLLGNLSNVTVQEDKAFFDFNGDGVLNNSDTTLLLDLITPPSSTPPATAPIQQEPQPAAPSTVLKLVAGRSTVNVNDGVTVDVVLAQAPQGLERFAFRVVLSPPGVARIAEFQSVTVTPRFVEVLSQTDNDIRFRGADLNNAVRAGTNNVVLARLQLRGLAPGTLQLKLSVEVFTGENSEQLAPEVSGAGLTFFQGPSPLEAGDNAPQDLDGDGLFEDVNGDGTFNSEDAVLLSFHLDDPVVLNNVAFFDFNGDGLISFADAKRLNDLLG